MNNEIETIQSFESLPKAVEALCLKVFGAKPLYIAGMFDGFPTPEMETLQEYLESQKRESYQLRCCLQELVEYFGIGKDLCPAKIVEKLKLEKDDKDDIETKWEELTKAIGVHGPESDPLLGRDTNDDIHNRALEQIRTLISPHLDKQSNTTTGQKHIVKPEDQDFHTSSKALEDATCSSDPGDSGEGRTVCTEHPQKEEIKNWLRQTNRSRSWLGEACGVRLGTVNNWLCTRANIPYATRALIARMMTDDTD